MKKRILLVLIFLLSLTSTLFASASGSDLQKIENQLVYGSFILVILILVFVIFLLMRTISLMFKAVLKAQGLSSTEIKAITNPVPVPKKSFSLFWEKFLSLRPLSEEKDMLLDHDYDGIHELNTPIPAWFQVLFFGTIAFAAGYLIVYQVFKWAPLPKEEYAIEMAKAEADKKLYLSRQPVQIDENSVKLVTDQATLDAGKTVYGLYCLACHGDKGQGLVGPNLTDDYWIHGGKIQDLFKTIKYGVQAKGMPTWEKQLSPKQISDVANYIKSLHGTNPPGAKPPQGEKVSELFDLKLKKVILALIY